jgi:prevent-host-death family protein
MARRRSSCSRCGEALDDFDVLLDARGDDGRPVCIACLDAADAADGSDTSTAGALATPSAPPGAGIATVGVRELRNQVAAVLRRAEAGERIVVTVDGRPVAQLGPLSAPGAPTLADLAAAGLVEPPRTARPADPRPEDLPADVRLDRLLEDLRGR